MLDEYVVMCLDTFAAIGVTFSEEEIGKLRDVLDGQASAAYAESPRSQIIISYESPGGSVVNYTVRAEWSSIESAYANWLETREPPYFGTSADARVLALADEEATPADAPVLDIGAGTGRNALALARRGHAVDAVEMTGVFAEGIREVAAAEGLPVRVIEADMSAARAALRHDYRLIVLSEVVTDFRGTAQLREMFSLAARHLARGGRLVFNAFLCADGYVPDVAVRQLGEQTFSTVFTSDEIEAAVAGLPLALASDVATYDYERAHLPPEHWPPTNWFEQWSRGLDILDLPEGESPIELRWLVFDRLG